MPSIAGVVHPPFTVRYSTKGVSDVATADHLTLLTLHHYSGTPVASSLLDAYRRHGVAAIHERGTDCALIVIDEQERRLVLSRDRVGVHPLYYQQCNEEFSFGSLIAGVRKHGSAPNREGLAALLVHGGAPSLRDTYFNDVHSVAPGETFCLENGRAKRLAARAWPANARDNIEFAQAVEEFGKRFEESVARRLSEDGTTAVLVSGGLDSASIIASARTDRAIGITYGLNDGSQADETRYVSLLQDAGHRIERVAFDPVIDFASLEQNIRAIETPLGDDVPATLARAAARARDLSCRVMLIGTWGDQVLAPFPPPHLQNVPSYRLLKLREHAKQLHYWMNDVPVNRIHNTLIRQSLRSHLPESLLRLIRRRRAASSEFDMLQRDYASHSYPPSPGSYADALRLNVSAPEQVEAIEATVKWGMANNLEVRLPFLDAELIGFLASVPDRVAYHNSSLKPLLRSAMDGIVPPEILMRRDKGDYTDAIRAGSLPLHAQLEELEELRRFVDFGLMSERQARTTLAKLTGRSKISSRTLDLAGSLLSVDTWLRIFFEAL